MVSETLNKLTMVLVVSEETKLKVVLMVSEETKIKLISEDLLAVIM